MIDADTTAQQTLRTLLRALDVDVPVYGSAESFLEQSKRTDALRCVIAELKLPGMSGLQLLRTLRAIDADLPIILLADEPDVPTAVAAMRDGATDFIDKQQMDVKIMRRVNQLLRNDHGKEFESAS